MYVSAGVVALVMVFSNVNTVYTAITLIAVSLLVGWGTGRIERWRHVVRHGRELDEPFLVEVLLDGKCVATLSDREVTEMFWRRYKITPRNHEDAALIANDSLWEQCRFTFRDPKSGMTCRTGFAGGAAPFVRDGRVSLRGLYFKADRGAEPSDSGATPKTGSPDAPRASVN